MKRSFGDLLKIRKEVSDVQSAVGKFAAPFGYRRAPLCGGSSTFGSTDFGRIRNSSESKQNAATENGFHHTTIGMKENAGLLVAHLFRLKMTDILVLLEVNLPLLWAQSQERFRY